jgi:hypothetical protein
MHNWLRGLWNWIKTHPYRAWLCFTFGGLIGLSLDWMLRHF